ncbi:hypothetical protein OPQ81_002738 [Rhizoctonia solani]|nr:hypothetical protein OPQ81_002738 [Rhizoctonia solani]
MVPPSPLAPPLPLPPSTSRDGPLLPPFWRLAPVRRPLRGSASRARVVTPGGLRTRGRHHGPSMGSPGIHPDLAVLPSVVDPGWEPRSLSRSLSARSYRARSDRAIRPRESAAASLFASLAPRALGGFPGRTRRHVDRSPLCHRPRRGWTPSPAWYSAPWLASLCLGQRLQEPRPHGGLLPASPPPSLLHIPGQTPQTRRDLPEIQTVTLGAYAMNLRPRPGRSPRAFYHSRPARAPAPRFPASSAWHLPYGGVVRTVVLRKPGKPLLRGRPIALSPF